MRCLTVLFLTAALFAQTESAWKRGEEALAAKDYQRAATAFMEVIQQQPRNAEASYKLGLARYQLGDFEGAAWGFKNAYDNHYRPMLSLVNRADSLGRAGKTEDAYATLELLAERGYPALALVLGDEDLKPLLAGPRWEAIEKKLRRNATPCEDSAEHRQFDFWIGEWNVQNAAGQPAGSSSVQRILEGCVIFENWTGGGGGTGKSFNAYNTPRKKWQQYWVDSGGTVTLFEGGWEDGAMRLAGETFPMQQAPGMRRMTFTPLGPDKVRQVGESSEDGGKTWKLEYDLTYIRKPKSE